MTIRGWWVLALALAVGAVAQGQEPGALPTGQGQNQEQGGGRVWVGGMGQGRGVMGTVTEVAADHFTVKNESGETWTVHFSANTRMMKMPPRPARAEGGQGQEGERRFAGGGGAGAEPIKPTDIKVGDAILAGGEVDAAGKSVGAMMVMQVDPERAKQMREMQANFGKTWLAGRVTAINDTTVTVEGGMDHAAHTFVADENTSFRKHREPITLGDIQVGDNVRVEGAIKDGQFVAATVNVTMPPATGGPVRRQGPPPQ
ncbi:MAG TPA: DUF5666 domain-containing protein [Terracidiphilus sp.]|jgi:preprotein translocase subunit YajC|nr:DUF5666 domain-containing protein [Terracidiphilus sp.]